MAKNGVEMRLKIGSKRCKDTCQVCIMGKSTRADIPKKSESCATGLLDLVHSDVMGLMPVSSLGGSVDFITFIDDDSKWTTTYTLRTKSESFEMFKRFRKYAKTQTGRQVVKIRSDNGGEYISNKFKEYLSDHGIHHQFTVAYAPQQNGVGRMNRSLKDLVSPMLHHKKVEHMFWAETFRNRVTSRSLPANTTPHKFGIGNTSDKSHISVLGSRCWYVLPKKKVNKLLKTVDRSSDRLLRLLGATGYFPKTSL